MYAMPLIASERDSNSNNNENYMNFYSSNVPHSVRTSLLRFKRASFPAYSKCHAPRTSVFEDDIATFKEESTPIEFSTATSLSSLTIDDELKVTNSSKSRSELKEAATDLAKEIKEESTEKASNVEAEKDQEQVSDGDEDDEDMLAACISMGIQNNR